MSRTSTGPLHADRATSPALLRDLADLTKPRITRMVVITAAMGFGMASAPAIRTAEPDDWLPMLGLLLAMCVGTALSSSGASALNCWWERERDGLMHRTADRPLPAERLAPRVALLIGLCLSMLGVASLAALTNIVAAAVAAFTIVTYVLVYTPLKPVTPLATIIGAVPGALPPLIGWAAGSVGVWRGLNEPGGWSIVAVMFVWQIPHFLAIAWMHREDYARGGHLVLPVIDLDGARTAWTSLIWTVTLIPISLAPVSAMPGRLGWGYTAAAALLGAGFVCFAVRLARSRTRGAARSLFFASIAYLPLLLAAMVADAAWRAAA